MTTALKAFKPYADTALICPFCLDEMNGDRLGHCGESSNQFETHHVWRTSKYDFDFLDPKTGEVLDGPADESRIV